MSLRHWLERRRTSRPRHCVWFRHGTKSTGALPMAALLCVAIMSTPTASGAGFPLTGDCWDAQFASPRQQWYDGWPWYHPLWTHPDDYDYRQRRKMRVPNVPQWCAHNWPLSAIPKSARDEYRKFGPFRVDPGDCRPCVQHLPDIMEFATETCTAEWALSMRVVWQLIIAKKRERPNFKVLSITTYPRRLSPGDRQFTVKCLEAVAAQRVYWSENADCTSGIWHKIVHSFPGKYVAHTAWCAQAKPNPGGK